MKIDGSIMIPVNCILENNLPTTIVGNQWYITVKNANDTVGKLWVPNSNGIPVCLGDTPITDSKIASLENQINVLNSHIAKLGVTQVRASNGGDANELKETDKIFIFNYVNIPSGTDYGLLEIYNLESGGFAPSTDAVVVQRFTSWWTGYIYTRVYRKQGDTYVWSDWNSPDEKIATLQEQLSATQEELVQLTNGTE